MNNYIVENDFIKVLNGIKKDFNSKEAFFNRRSEFASLTREGYSMGQIAEKFNISRQAVSLALKKAVKEGQIVYKTRKGTNDSNNYVIISKKKPMQKSICIECEKSFLSDKKRKTCSKNCLVKNRQKDGGEWSRLLFLDLVCKGCGKNFKRSKYLQKINEYKKKTKNYYCSRDCYCKTMNKNV